MQRIVARVRHNCKYILIGCGVFLLLSTSVSAHADENRADVYYRAKVVSVEEKTIAGEFGTQSVQQVRLRIVQGDEKDTEIDIAHGADFTLLEQQRVSEGQTVVINKTQTHGPGNEHEFFYYIVEPYRLPWLLVVFCIFFAIAVLFARKKGLLAIIGLVFSIFVLIQLVVPWIISGVDPLWASIVGSVIIACIALYLAHGFHARTTIALISTLITLALAAVLAYVFVRMSSLFGFGSEEALFLQNGSMPTLDMRGLLLGGIIIGALGVLDDITTAQTAAIEEIHQANTSLEFRELYRRGFSVGREHIASLINTLALAYVGASFPMLLLFSTTAVQPLWVTANREDIAEEIMRTLIGSTALIFAVPITTFLAAYYFGRKRGRP